MKKILLIILLCSLASASTKYVAKTGNDNTGDGSSGNPYLTIEKLFTVMSAGDSAVIRSGTYTPATTLVPPSGSAGSYIKIAAYSGETVVLNGGSNSLMNLTNKIYIKFYGLSFTTASAGVGAYMFEFENTKHVEFYNNAFYSMPAPNGTENTAVIRCMASGDSDPTGLINSDTCIFKNNYFHDNLSPAIRIYDTKGWLIEGNTFINCSQAIGMKEQPFYDVIKRNLIIGSTATAFYLPFQEGGNHDSIYENIIINSAVAFLWGGLGSSYMRSAIAIHNNTIYNCNNALAGFNDAYFTNISFYNNIFYSDSALNISSGEDLPARIITMNKYDATNPLTISNYSFAKNCYWQPAADNSKKFLDATTTYTDLAAWQSAKSFDAGSLWRVPVFKDKAKRDYRVQDSSACKLAGVGSVDIGAYTSNTSEVIIGSTLYPYLFNTNIDTVKDTLATCGDTTWVKAAMSEHYKIDSIHIISGTGTVGKRGLDTVFSKPATGQTLMSQVYFGILPTYTVTATAGAGGTITTTTPLTQDSATVFHFTASANTGCQFVNWTGGVTFLNISNGTAVCSLTTTSNQTVTANFVGIPIYKNITVSTQVGGTTAPIGVQSVEALHYLRISATQTTGTFNSWVGTPNLIITDPTALITDCATKDSADATVTATYNPIIKTNITYDNFAQIVVGKNWAMVDTTTKLKTKHWTDCTTSDDGLFSAVVGIGKSGANKDSIYTTKNGGVTWKGHTPVKPFNCIKACKKYPKYMTAWAYNDSVFTSKDSGETWIAREVKRLWDYGCIADDDPKYQYESVDGGYLYRSIDTGKTWIQSDSIKPWRQIACSGDGKHVGAVMYGGDTGFIHISHDYGVTYKSVWNRDGWSAGNGLNSITISCSRDGKYWLAPVTEGYIRVSQDSGETWTIRGESHNYYASKISETGKFMIAAALFKYPMYVSSDFGVTWVPGVDSMNYYGLDMSRDFMKGIFVTSSNDGVSVIAANDSGLIFTSNNVLHYWNDNKSNAKTVVTIPKSKIIDTISAFVYHKKISTLPDTFLAYIKSDCTDLRVFNAAGDSCPMQITGTTPATAYVYWKDTASNIKNNVFQFECGSGISHSNKTTAWTGAGYFAVHHYEEASGNALDATGNYTGTVSGATYGATGKNGKAFIYPGSGNTNLGTLTQLNNTEHFTFMAWFRIGAPGNYYLFSRGTSGVNFGLQVYSDKYLYAYMYTGSANPYISYNLAPYMDSAYHMVTLRYDGTKTGNDNRYQLYIDSTKVTTLNSGTIPAATQTDNSAMTISKAANSWNGYIDETRWNSRTMSNAEIKATARNYMDSTFTSVTEAEFAKDSIISVTPSTIHLDYSDSNRIITVLYHGNYKANDSMAIWLNGVSLGVAQSYTDSTIIDTIPKTLSAGNYLVVLKSGQSIISYNDGPQISLIKSGISGGLIGGLTSAFVLGAFAFAVYRRGAFRNRSFR